MSSIYIFTKMVLANVLTGILAGLIALLVALYIYFTWNFNYWTKRGVAGPKPSPYLGTYPKLTTKQKNTNFLIESHEIYKYVIRLICVNLDNK